MKATYLFLFLLLAGRTAFGQGSLTPPGAPAPTMKTLDQVEARTPIPSIASTYFILQDGSYYLTGNFYIPGGRAIQISANNVTLDLNGYTIMAIPPGSNNPDVAIAYTGAGNLMVRNGHIQGLTTYSNNGGFSGGGFSDGVSVGANAHSVRIENVDVYGVSGAGINIAAVDAVISHCQTYVTGGNGIVASQPSSVIDHCVQQTCGNNGITGGAISDCFGTSLGGRGINGVTALNCTGTTNSGSAVFASSAATNCDGTANTSGKGVETGVATNCGGSTNSGIGVYASATASHCHGTSVAANSTGVFSGAVAVGCFGTTTSGTGLYAVTANDCQGNCAASGAFALYAYSTANGCGATALGGTALKAGSVSNCTATATGSDPALVCANGSVSNCTVTAVNGIGINAFSVTNSSAIVSSGVAIQARTVTGSTGYCNGSGTGISAFAVATSCFGSTGGNDSGSYAIICANGVVTDCTTHAPGAAATEVLTFIANGCHLSGSGRNLATNQYNMPASGPVARAASVSRSASAVNP